MLVLTRWVKTDDRHDGIDTITIHCPDGAEIRIVLNDASGGRARIGFEAPEDYLIERADAISHKPKER